MNNRDELKYGLFFNGDEATYEPISEGEFEIIVEYKKVLADMREWHVDNVCYDYDENEVFVNLREVE